MEKIREHRLIAIDSNMEIREIDLNAFRKNVITFGRDMSNQIVFSSVIVSKIHGAFEISGNDIYIYDKGSTNGTIINNYIYKNPGQGNSEAHRLVSGDIIRIDHTDGTGHHKASVMMIYSTSRMIGTWQKVQIPDQGQLIIGRSSKCNVCLKSINVSRKHAAISVRRGQFYIEDLKSSNGLFVNGQRVFGGAYVAEKDVIGIANSTLLLMNGMLVYKANVDGTKVVMRDIYRTVTVKGRKLTILEDVNITVEPNEFIAIIGGSGAGKSTVMNAMSGFEQATSGHVYVNDVDLYSNYQSLKNMIGYVPQQDIIYENITLMKMLEYSAKMRMGDDVSPQERKKRIDEVLKMVELDEHKDQFIRSLSGGQRKRASIAVELLADPGLFFLDEPTSGLDPGTEESLMKTLNTLSKQKGKTIVMVTHTTQNLHLCDKVLFMGRGGRVCFYGAPDDCIRFFNVNSLTEVYNMLLKENDVQYWSQKYAKEAGEYSNRLSGHSKGTEIKKRVSFFKQFGILSSRYMTLIKNDVQRLIMVFAQPVIIAMFIALVAADDCFEIYESTRSILFSLSCAGIWVGLFNSIQEICKERNILKREYMANLRLGAYVLSKYAVQFLISVIQAVVMILIFSLMVGSPEHGVGSAGKYVEMFITMLLTIFSSAAIGLVVSAVSKTNDKAMIAAPFLLILQLLFSGILFELKGAAEKISYITVSKWSVSAFGTIADLNYLKLKIKMIEHEPEEIYRHTVANMCSSWAVMAGFVILCALVCVLLLRSVSKDSR